MNERQKHSNNKVGTIIYYGNNYSPRVKINKNGKQLFRKETKEIVKPKDIITVIIKNTCVVFMKNKELIDSISVDWNELDINIMYPFVCIYGKKPLKFTFL